MEFGVPQGSTLGPLLFILFINDISDSLQSAKSVMYADDVIVYVSHEDSDTAKRLLQNDLTRLHEWCLSNSMTVNTEKSMTMLFGSKHRIEHSGDITIQMGTDILPSTDTYSYLGVELDGPLTVNPHTGKVKKSVGNKIFKLGRLSKRVPNDCCLAVYKTMIAPVMDYCSFYTGSACQSELTKLQRLQNRALRICTKSRLREVSVDALHTVTGVLKLDDKRKKQLTKIMWKSALQGEATTGVHARTRGDNKLKFRIRRPKSAFYQKSPYYRGVKLWNELEPSVQKLKSEDEFNRELGLLYPVNY